MPQRQSVDVPFPLAGLEEYRALTNGRVFNGRTSAASTQGALNTRGIDPASGRARGASRCGTTKFYASQINGSNSIQEIAPIVGGALGTQQFIGQLAVCVQPAAAARGIGLFTSLGVAYSTDASLSSSDIVGPTCWDTTGNYYYVYRKNSSSKFVVIKKECNTAVTQWTSADFSATSGSTYIPLGIAVSGSLVYVYVRTSGANNYEIWRFNTSDGAVKTSDSSAAWKHANASGGTISGLAQHADGATAIGNCLAASGSSIAILEITDTSNLYARIITDITGTGTVGSQVLLLGPKTGANSFAINIVGDTAGNYFWSGFKGGDATSQIGRLTSGGVSTSTNGYATVSYSPISQQLMSIDTSSRVAYFTDTLTLLKTEFTTYQGSTVSGWNHSYATPTGGIVLAKQGTSGASSATYAMTDANANILWTSSYDGIRYQFASVNQYLPNGADSLAYWRSSALLIVSDGTVKKLDNGTLTTVTDGTQILNRNANVIFSAQVGSAMYFADGASAAYFYFPDQRCYKWIASSGLLPYDSSGARHSLIAAWRNRVVVGGYKQDATFVAASKVLNPLNFNYAPSPPTAEDAWFDNLPDQLNAIVPYNDDILIMGCDHSILQYTGDPTDGGRRDVISDTVGMAWGRPYCRSGSGILYFVGSRGGVYRMVPGQIPEPISSMAINERLADVDYSTHIIRMAWDDRQQGFYLIISPLDATASTTHYWYDARNNAWWPDAFTTASHNPLAVTVIDGADPDDRRVLFGSRDGYIRQVDLDATTDDGVAINSYVFLGPFNNMLLNEIKPSFDNATSDLTASLHVGDTAQNALAAAASWSATLTAGNNPTHFPRRYAPAVYLKLASSAYWSLEEIVATIIPGSAGRRRRS